MCPRCHEFSRIASIGFASITEEKKNDYCPYPLSSSASPDPSTVSTMSESSAPNFVYSRKRLRGNSVAIFSALAPASTKRSIEDSVSVISSDTPSVTVTEQYVVSQAEPTVGAPIMPCMVLQGDPRVFQSESINRCSLVVGRGSDEASKNSSQKIIELDSINDSCCSSKSDMELVSASMQTEEDETGECSSSSVMIVEASGEYLSENDLCISIVRIQGHEGVSSSRTRTSAEGVVDSSASSNSWSCKICANPESTLKMLICDNCEEAFHLSCCNPRVKRIPLDEWFCHSCSKKRRKILKEGMSRSYPNMIGEKGTCGNSSTDQLNHIALMLKDAGSYTSGVRIGKGFQAEVPDWSGPITKDIDTIGEALEMDPSNFPNLTELKSNKPKLGSIGNWLQCREVIDGAGERINATICGKWRRAPLFEVQTDDWECFCSVLWDPIHADCAVPQELDTDQILMQLKYIQMLRP